MTHPKTDDALESARRALEEAGTIDRTQETHAREKAEAATPLDESLLGFSVREKIAQVRQASKTFNRAAQAVDTVMGYAGPVGRAALTIGGFLTSAFKYAAFEREGWNFKRDADGDLIFSPKRLATSFLLAGMIGTSAAVGAQYAYYDATKFHELVYVTGKQEIEAGELYHVTGCTSLPCSTETDNGKYYQIEKSWFAPRQIYPEENVYANIPQQLSACSIDGYGIYFKQLKPFFRWTEWYQNIEKVSCRPLTEAEVKTAINDGLKPVIDTPVLQPALQP